MYPFETRLYELLDRLCDCEDYFECEWHARLRRGDDHGEMDKQAFENEMEWELNRRHCFGLYGVDIDNLPLDVQEDVADAEDYL